MNKGFRYTAFIVLVGLLVLIRVFEAQLFYVPYLAFFKNDYLYIDSPRQEVFKLAAFTTLRYVLNSVISLGILFVLFKDLSIIKFSVLIYVLAYVVFMSLFLYFIIYLKQYFISFRYVLNSLISLCILFVLFKDLSIIKFSVLIYALAYVVFMSLFLYFVIHPKQEDYYLFFNVRRFLIQPLMALLLIPAFYYHKQRL